MSNVLKEQYMQHDSRLLIAVSFVRAANPSDPSDLPLQPCDLVFDLSVPPFIPPKTKTAAKTPDGVWYSSLDSRYYTGLARNCLVFKMMPYLTS